MATELFAGIPVSDLEAACAWYERLLGAPPAFFPNDAEAVWELGEHRWVYVVRRPERAGHAVVTLIVDDLDARLTQIAARGLEPATREDYEDGTRKITFRDADGNELAFGAAPPEQ